jgi:TonB-dependent starch-binding outer membrane protein SusC
MHLTAIVRRGLSEKLDLCKAGVSSFYRAVIVFVKTKTFLVMRLTSIFLLASCMQLSAAGYGQRVSISGQNMSLKKVFNEIQKQSGYSFFYSDKALSGARSVTIDMKDAELEKVLQQVFHLQPLTYAIIENTIVVKERLPVVDESVTKSLPPPIDVSGRVVNANGEAVAGVTVTVKGTKHGTSTDANGYFALRGVSENAVIVFSGINILNNEVSVNGRSDMGTISTKAKVSQVSDTVIIGYGSVRRRDLTGSVSSIKVDEIKDMPLVTFDNAMAGKASGVQVIKSDGSPGGGVRIRIRGGASLIGSNDPLYIIDGVPVMIENKYVGITDVTNPIENYGGENARNSTISGSFARGLNNLAGLNIDDIESIDILKDASSTAIYGSRAANGVVIITTKKGKLNQKPVLELNYYTGVSNPRKERVLNRDEYLMIKQEAAKNRVAEDIRLGRPADANATAIAANPGIIGMPGASVDWLDLVLRNGFTQNATISVRGGGTGSRYYTSLNYMNSKGAVIASDFSRLAGKFSLDNEITNKLKVITNLDWGYHKNNVVGGIYSNALLAPPVIKPYNDDGSFVNFDVYNRGSDFGAQNPLALATQLNTAKTYTLLGSLALEYDIIRDLKFRSVASTNFSSYRQRNYTPSYLEIANPASQGGQSSGGGVGSQSTRQAIDVLFENTLTWDKQLNDDHRLNLFGGTSWQKYRSEFFSAEGRGYPDDNFLNNLNAAATPLSVRGMDPEGRNALLSFYARANYAFKEKYLVTLSARQDISSKFATGRQSEFFPSGAIAWRISDENFMKGASSWINELKLRVSAGYVGTNSISDFMYLTLFSPTSYAGAPAVVPTQLGNDELKWERTLQKDLGLDFRFFNNRLSGTFGYYEKGTNGLLLNVTPAPSYAFGSVILNIADITNKGLELELRADVFRSKNFNWNSAINISRNRSVVTSIKGGPFSNPADRNNLNLGTSVVREGEPLGLLWGRVVSSIISTQKELDDYKAAAPFQLIFNRWMNIGDVKMDTVAGSGGLWREDVIGNTVPDFYGGFTNIFTYRNFNLNTHFTFSYGNDILFQRDVSNRQVTNLINHGADILKRWTPQNPSTTRERLLWGGFVSRSNLNVYDGSYLKLRSVSLGYDLPKAVMERFKLRTASFYVSATNLLIISNYPGMDPEVSDNPSSVIGGGRDLSTFPSTREFTIGFRLGL